MIALKKIPVYHHVPSLTLLLFLIADENIKMRVARHRVFTEFTAHAIDRHVHIFLDFDVIILKFGVKG